MAKKTPKTPRKPTRKPARRPAKAPKAKAAKARPLLKDLRRECAALIAKDGVAEILQLSDEDSSAHTRMFVSTGSLELDRHLTPTWSKVGGIPGGRVTEIYGPEHLGKSTILDHVFSNVQKMGGVGVLIETDAGRDEHYTAAVGVNTAELDRIEFKGQGGMNLENALDVMASTALFWREKALAIPVVIGFDALAVTPTQDEVSKTIAKGTTASAAKVLRRGCRKLSGILSGTNIAIVVINHEYQQIGFGGPVKARVTYGGDALRLLASLRLRLHRTTSAELSRGDGVPVGNKIGIRIVKWKLGGAGRDIEIALLHGIGIDNAWTIWNRLVEKRLIVTSGSWSALSINGVDHKFQGFLGLRDKCLADPALFDQLVAAYYQTMEVAPC